MYVDNQYLKAIPATDPTAIFLNRDTPTGLFAGQNTQMFWVVLNGSGKWAIKLSDLYTPLFAAFPLDDHRLEYGWDLGELQLSLGAKMRTTEENDVGLIRIEGSDVAMSCCRPDGTLTWVSLGNIVREGLSGYFESWQVCRVSRPDHVVAERNDGIYGVEPFTAFFPVECAEEIDLIVNYRE